MISATSAATARMAERKSSCPASAREMRKNWFSRGLERGCVHRDLLLRTHDDPVAGLGGRGERATDLRDPAKPVRVRT